MYCGYSVKDSIHFYRSRNWNSLASQEEDELSYITDNLWCFDKETSCTLDVYFLCCLKVTEKKSLLLPDDIMITNFLQDKL
jgi:hypothetical protein